MNNAEKFADVIGAVYWAKVEHGITRLSVRCDGGLTSCDAMTYILSGTSMPSSCMPFLMVLATFFANAKRNVLASALSALRML